MTFFGALVNAASGAFTYHQIADRLAYVVGLILAGEKTDDRPDRQAAARSVRLRLPRRSVPVLPAATRRRAAVPQRGAGVLGAVATSRRAAGLPQQHHTVQPRRRLAGPGVARTACVQDHVVPGDGRSRPSAAAHAGVERLYAAPDPRTRGAGHRAGGATPRRHAGQGGVRSPSTTSRSSPASCRWT